MERTGTGDPLRVLPLLWGEAAKPGRKGLTLEAIRLAATSLADRVGIDQVSMRRLADDLGVGTMTLYSHVPGRGELIDLMVDHAHAEVDYPSGGEPGPWRTSLENVAEANWRLLQRHPWLLDLDTTRPPLGPGTLAKYDAELSVLTDSGLDDVQIDQVLSLVLEHVRASARQTMERDVNAKNTGTDADWWARTGPILATLVDPERYPYASRIGEAAGQEYGSTVDPERAYAFGLQTILDGVEALINR